MTQAIKAEIEAWCVEGSEVAGVELFDVELTTPGRWSVCVFCQRAGNPGPGEGITIEECAQVSRYVEALLDADERVPENYLLEVSSPGIERNLKKASHYEQVLGERVRVVVREAIESQYAFEGILKEMTADGAGIVLEIEGAGDALEQREFPLASIKRANTVYDFTSGN